MPIEEKKISELPQAQIALFDRAKSAIGQHNYSYAFEMLQTILRAHPGCSQARKALRAAQLARWGEKVNPLLKVLAAVKTAMPVFIKGPLLLKRGKVLEALDMAESAVSEDPTAIPALHFLFNTARAAGLEPVADEALEICARYNPKDMMTLRKCIGHFEETGQVMKALKYLQQLSAMRPNDLNLHRALKQATAEATMRRDRWDEAAAEDKDGYRKLLKDKDGAQKLEQQERVGARDEGTLQNLIRAAEQEVEAKPVAASHRQLAELYVRAQQYDEALEQYELVVEKLGAMDPAIDDAITKVHMKRFDKAIDDWREYAGEDADRQAEAEEKIAEIETQRAEMLFERYKERVQRYPNDARYRFEYGEQLYERGMIDEALKEFQRSQRSPQLRRKSFAFMGRCMAKKGMIDMAIEEFNNALGDGERIDALAKEVLYDLALLYDDLGDEEKALKCLKDIYGVDVNYRDVGERIEVYYRKQREG